MTNVYSDSVLCVPGVQNILPTDEEWARSYFCEPGRITGNHVHIFRTVTNTEQICVCEIAVFEETKRKFHIHIQTCSKHTANSNY